MKSTTEETSVTNQIFGDIGNGHEVNNTSKAWHILKGKGSLASQPGETARQVLGDIAGNSQVSKDSQAWQKLLIAKQSQQEKVNASKSSSPANS